MENSEEILNAVKNEFLVSINVSFQMFPFKPLWKYHKTF